MTVSRSTVTTRSPPKVWMRSEPLRAPLGTKTETTDGVLLTGLARVSSRPPAAPRNTTDSTPSMPVPRRLSFWPRPQVQAVPLAQTALSTEAAPGADAPPVSSEADATANVDVAISRAEQHSVRRRRDTEKFLFVGLRG